MNTAPAPPSGAATITADGCGVATALVSRWGRWCRGEVPGSEARSARFLGGGWPWGQVGQGRAAAPAVSRAMA